jgi:hypothetical protein
MLVINDIARICHEANRALCKALGDRVLPEWDALDNETQGITIRGVRYVLEPFTERSLHEMHERWRVDKIMHGWTYGEVIDDLKKTHKNMVSYADLPIEQKGKDALFLNVVVTLEGLM